MINISFEILKSNLNCCDSSKTGCGTSGCKRSEGRIPRGLYFEERAKDSPCTVVVGMNPSPADEKECDHIKNKANQFEVWEKWFSKSNGVLQSYSYYVNTRSFLNALGCKGDILWTECHYCEEDRFDIDVARVCMNQHLNQQLSWAKQKFGDNYLVLALGEVTYELLRMHPEFTSLIPKLIGIYHPSGRQAWRLEEMFIPFEDRQFSEKTGLFVQSKKDEGPFFIKTKNISG
ncbi:MAG TPA: hypothetical protein VFO76_00070 [Candidatus Kapabacteria bacterium]|nr:hypothetical protein [Candidatus Kapabacteria bacterium]